MFGGFVLVVGMSEQNWSNFFFVYSFFNTKSLFEIVFIVSVFCNPNANS